jgi:hypothetical protein
MPTITRTLIKTGMAYALVGTVLSGLWFLHLISPLHPVFGYLQPTAIHLVVVGWLTQLIFGVALWMFPPWSKQAPRGPEQANWACYLLLNTGLLLRLIAEPLNGYRPSMILGWMLVASAVFQVLAIWIFVGLVWSRVRTKPGGR